VIEHEVLLVKRTLQRLCRPKWIAFPGQDAVEVAQMLGIGQQNLRKARLAGVFRERYYKGLGGKPGRPIPVISSDEPLDPSMANFYSRDPFWGSTWELFPDMVPDDFQQPIIRRPNYRPFGRAGGARAREDQVYTDECQFLGYHWVCPGCKREVRTIYYPIPVRTLFDSWFPDPVKRLKLSDVDLLQPPPPTFACRRCHGVIDFSSTTPLFWNQLITYLTGGMLYGCEVEKPASFVPHRKRPFRHKLGFSAPKQRQVLTRLRNGWSNSQIARDMGISKRAVEHHIARLCRQEQVPDRHALAEKLQFAKSPPLHQQERAGARRIIVKDLLIQGLSYQQIMAKLNLDYSTVNRDVIAIYEIHGVTGLANKARQALAQKLGIAPPLTEIEQLCPKVAELRDRGLKRRHIAAELNISPRKAAYCLWVLQGSRARTALTPPVPALETAPSS
jgi:DNA-binding NarL/FixJ family response regulator